jgi:hypothetical protein
VTLDVEKVGKAVPARYLAALTDHAVTRARGRGKRYFIHADFGRMALPCNFVQYKVPTQP